MTPITQQQRDLLLHTLGLSAFNRVSYRNHFVAGPGHYAMADLEVMEAAGLVKRGRTPGFCDDGDVVFQATDEGRERAIESIPKPPVLSKSKQNYQNYLDNDGCCTFAEHLRIDKPVLETDYGAYKYPRTGNKYRYSRLKDYPYELIEGEWKPTMKEAKASYKAALKAQKKKQSALNRAWHNEG